MTDNFTRHLIMILIELRRTFEYSRQFKAGEITLAELQTLLDNNRLTCDCSDCKTVGG